MKNIWCGVGITLVLSSIIMSVLNLKKDEFNVFVDLLDDKQKKLYNDIVVERVTIYNIGMVLGIIAGFLYYYYNKKDKYVFCKAITIMSIVKLAVYYFYPKQPLMLNHLTTIEQVDAWEYIYSTMKEKWQQSIILGFIGYIFISYSMK